MASIFCGFCPPPPSFSRKYKVGIPTSNCAPSARGHDLANPVRNNLIESSSTPPMLRGAVDFVNTRSSLQRPLAVTNRRLTRGWTRYTYVHDASSVFNHRHDRPVSRRVLRRQGPRGPCRYVDRRDQRYAATADVDSDS